MNPKEELAILEYVYDHSPAVHLPDSQHISVSGLWYLYNHGFICHDALKEHFILTPKGKSRYLYLKDLAAFSPSAEEHAPQPTAHLKSEKHGGYVRNLFQRAGYRIKKGSKYLCVTFLTAVIGAIATWLVENPQFIKHFVQQFLAFFASFFH